MLHTNCIYTCLWLAAYLVHLGNIIETEVKWLYGDEAGAPLVALMLLLLWILLLMVVLLLLLLQLRLH